MLRIATAGLLFICSAAFGEELAAQLDRLIVKLDDDNFQAREAATQAIADLPAEAYALAEAALQRDMGAEARERLERARGSLRVKSQRAVADARRAAHRAWNEKRLLDGYEKIGHKDPRWDDSVRTVIREIINGTVRDPRFECNEEAALAACDKAMAAGCDDPQFLFLRQDLFYELKRETKGDSAHSEIMEALYASGYSARLKFFALVRGAEWALAMKNDESRDKASVCLDRALALMPELAREPEMPLESFLRVCTWWVDSAAGLGKVRREAMERMYDVLRKEFPGKTLPILLKAIVTQTTAIKTENVADRREWALEAEKMLKETLKIDPADSIALTQMIGICGMLRYPRDSMEQFFKRAMDADPYSYLACDMKAWYLRPEVAGSMEEWWKFARECRDGGNWSCMIPYIFVGVHLEMAKAGNEAAYFKDPKVWQEIEPFFEEWFKRYPDTRYGHSKYARLAAISERWEIAAREFKRLGEYPSIRAFKDRDEYERLRKAALEHAEKK